MTQMLNVEVDGTSSDFIHMVDIKKKKPAYLEPSCKPMTILEDNKFAYPGGQC